ncbi:hypothetical protein SCHPADRAFT_176954 [Schizopora paradoxa]|uniref:Uncharacterized protein n=1 Tax=Schizopora paradoxa TaxID=27342 RepID=A0A0H2SJB4_9AGAM|nr:hypothetical protein SCHPADRAFT_176954 [Schizopora paradoxa]
MRDSYDAAHSLYDEVDEFHELYANAHKLMFKKGVFALSEMRLQLVKVVRALLAVIKTTDTSIPNLLSGFYAHNNVVVIQTTTCKSSGETVSALICGEREDLSFLSFLLHAHQYGQVEKLRKKALPNVHDDLHLKWDPEVLYDEPLRRRIMSATTATITEGPSSFLMVPLVEMRLDRTKIVTQKHTIGNFQFIIDAIPDAYIDYLELFLNLD